MTCVTHHCTARVVPVVQLLLEEDAVEEVDKIELSKISPVAKRRKKYVNIVIEDSDSE